jgi:RNA polymerase sigma factor (sigma-70 family)
VKRAVVPLIRVEGLPSEMPDEALVAAIGAGASAALGALYDRHHVIVRRFLARLSGTDDRDLDDLVQATFEAVVRAARSFDNRSSARTWLLGIANNTARRHVRTEVRRRKLSEVVTLDLSGAAAVSDPGSDAAARERAVRLQQAILALPPKLRETFVLVYLEGLPGAEVARLLDAREGTIWKRLHEARAKLRGFLEGVWS